MHLRVVRIPKDFQEVEVTELSKGWDLPPRMTARLPSPTVDSHGCGGGRSSYQPRRPRVAEPGRQTRRTANPRATHRREGELVCDLPIVFVPLLHLRLPSRQVAADETEAGAVELKADAHRALIARLSPHASLHGVDGHVPVTKEHRGMATPTLTRPRPLQMRSRPLRQGHTHSESSETTVTG